MLAVVPEKEMLKKREQDRKTRKIRAMRLQQQGRAGQSLFDVEDHADEFPLEELGAMVNDDAAQYVAQDLRRHSVADRFLEAFGAESFKPQMFQKTGLLREVDANGNVVEKEEERALMNSKQKSKAEKLVRRSVELNDEDLLAQIIKMNQEHA